MMSEKLKQLFRKENWPIFLILGFGVSLKILRWLLFMRMDSDSRRHAPYLCKITVSDGNRTIPAYVHQQDQFYCDVYNATDRVLPPLIILLGIFLSFKLLQRIKQGGWSHLKTFEGIRDCLLLLMLLSMLVTVTFMMVRIRFETSSGF